MSFTLRVCSLLMGVLLVATATAQDAKSERKSDVEKTSRAAEARKTVEGFWNVPGILETAVNNISRRYNLNEQQREITNEMMTTRVTKFLDDYQDQLWPLIRDLIMYQRKGELPDREAARELGPVAMKIIKEAKEEIFRSNREWGEILTSEQRLVHDYDMKEMAKSFQLIEDNFKGWVEGNPQNGSIFPQPRPLVNEPARPTKPKPGLPVDKKDVPGPLLDDKFDTYVGQFITDYVLTPPQIEAAQSILREIKLRAAAFRKANGDKIDEVKQKLADAKDVKERREVMAQMRRLTKPINTLFTELKNRLVQIPDRVQRARYDAKPHRGESPKAAIIDSKDADDKPENKRSSSGKKTDQR